MPLTLLSLSEGEKLIRRRRKEYRVRRKAGLGTWSGSAVLEEAERCCCCLVVVRLRLERGRRKRLRVVVFLEETWSLRAASGRSNKRSPCAVTMWTGLGFRWLVGADDGNASWHRHRVRLCIELFAKLTKNWREKNSKAVLYCCLIFDLRITKRRGDVS